MAGLTKVMRVALILVIGIHGLIHLLGFLRAFGVFEFNAIEPISKIPGFFGLLTFLLFAATIILLLVQPKYWWACGFLALTASQGLIISHWHDSKFGTIANIIILLAAVVAYSSYNFENTIKQERIALFKKSVKVPGKIVNVDDISMLPPVVQKWLITSGVIGKPSVSTVYLTQELQLKLEPGQRGWNKGTAEQYFTIQPPAFHWNINTKMKPALRVVGRDKFVDGRGEMQIKLLSFIPVANASHDKKIDQATLQRNLAEIVWFPSASLSPYIKWESLGSSSARATMEFKGTKGSGVFYFDQNGHFKEFVAMRYKDKSDNNPTMWTVTATKIEERNGIKIPTGCEVSWNTDREQWVWLMLSIKHIEYNVEKMPVVNN